MQVCDEKEQAHARFFFFVIYIFWIMFMSLVMFTFLLCL